MVYIIYVHGHSEFCFVFAENMIRLREAKIFILKIYRPIRTKKLKLLNDFFLKSWYIQLFQTSSGIIFFISGYS